MLFLDLSAYLTVWYMPLCNVILETVSSSQDCSLQLNAFILQGCQWLPISHNPSVNVLQRSTYVYNWPLEVLIFAVLVTDFTLRPRSLKLRPNISM